MTMTTASDVFWRESQIETCQFIAIFLLSLLQFTVIMKFKTSSRFSFGVKGIMSFSIYLIQALLLPITKTEMLNFVDWAKCIVVFVTFTITYIYYFKTGIRLVSTLFRQPARDQNYEVHPAVQNLGANSNSVDALRRFYEDHDRNNRYVDPIINNVARGDTDV